MNQLYYGDNLDVLRKHIPDESVDLIYLDPPFNSQRAYNIIFQDKKGKQPVSQIEAFEDTWRWTPLTTQAFDEVMANPSAPHPLKQMLTAFKAFMGPSDLMAYLTMMAIRLVELHRVLKKTGSLYLHCDATASHYLKMLLDNIFGLQNYRNEIHWKRTLGHHLSTRSFDKMIDSIFFYTKNEGHVFHPQFKSVAEKKILDKFPYVEPETGRKFTHEKLEKTSNAYSKGETRIIQGRSVVSNVGWIWTQDTFDERLMDNPNLIFWTGEGRPRYKRYADEYLGRQSSDLWDDIAPLSSNSSERLGYPTQKPLAVLDRVLQTSSNEGDVVLDPFCGCGTTVVAAERLGRRWIGIDITYYAIGLVKKRLAEQCPGAAYLEDGIPKSYDDAVQLSKKPFQFESWAVSLVGGQPFKSTGGGDTGIDGLLFFKDYAAEHHRIIVEVKGGGYHPKEVRALKQVMDREKAPLGILIALQDPTKGMVAEAAALGRWKLPGGQVEYPILQIFTIQDYFDGKRPHLPDTSGTLKEAKRVIREREKHPKLPGLE